MAKLAILAVLLVAVVAIAQATTTITTTVIEENPTGWMGKQMQCSEQIQGKVFTHCMDYLMEGGSSSRGRVYLNPQQMHLSECCAQLENVDEECRCSAIQKVVQRTQQEMQSYQGMEMKQIMKDAMELPKQCQWMQPKQCQTRAVFV